MNKFTNPLDDIKIASPCSANWDEMIGDDRQRHCAECRLNVYNLSAMTQTEAENLLINSEGRVCLQIYRRSDGTILTQDCPVGWLALKKKVSRSAAAVFTLIMGLFAGILSLESLKALRALTNYDEVPEIFFKTKKAKEFNNKKGGLSFGGALNNLPEIKIEILKSRRR